MTGRGNAMGYGRDEMRELLGTGARLEDRPSAAAAVHLLTFTDLPGRRDFARHVRIENVTGAGGGTVLAAWVRNWDRLLGDGSVYLSGGLRRLLEVAASYATGRPVDLRDTSSGLGTAHAGRLIEAVVTGTGMAQYYTITGTAKLAGLRRWHGGLPGDVGVR
jgi:hypothetical protein